MRSGATTVRCAARVALTRSQSSGPLRRVAAAAATKRRTWSSRPVVVEVRQLSKGMHVPVGVRTYATRSADEIMEVIEEQ